MQRLSVNFAKVCFSLVACLLSANIAGAAVTLEDLYKVETLVISQSGKELSRASEAGLRTVLIRVSGDPKSIDSPVLRAALRSPRRYLSQYSYQSRDSDEGLSELLVHLEYEKTLIEQLLREARLPVWSETRPSILVWLLLDQGGERTVVNGTTASELVAALDVHARRRGLEFTYPLLDLEDSSKVSVADIRKRNMGAIALGSKRYQADTVLVGTATALSDDSLVGNWAYQIGQKDYYFDGLKNIDDGYAAAIADNVANALAKKYAFQSEGFLEQGVLMTVADVENYADYARVINYLESISAVELVSVRQLDAENLQLSLSLHGAVKQLKQTLALDKKMLPEDNSLGGSLYYRWLGK